MAIDFRRLAVATGGFATFLHLYAPQALVPELAREFGVGAAQISAMITASTLAIALTAPFTGAVADVLGRKGLITSAMFAVTVPMVMVTISTDVGTIIAWRFIQGLLCRRSLPSCSAISVMSGRPLRLPGSRVCMFPDRAWAAYAAASSRACLPISSAGVSHCSHSQGCGSLPDRHRTDAVDRASRAAVRAAHLHDRRACYLDGGPCASPGVVSGGHPALPFPLGPPRGRVAGNHARTRWGGTSPGAPPPAQRT